MQAPPALYFQKIKEYHTTIKICGKLPSCLHKELIYYIISNKIKLFIAFLFYIFRIRTRCFFPDEAFPQIS